jgi:Lrp/AsnC family transcriptional regulator, regulator for asnA, asnC and gidA
MKKQAKPEIDLVDKKIINLLASDAHIQYAEISSKTNIAPATVHLRIKKLKRLEILQEATTRIQFSKLGYDLTAFVGIYLTQSDMLDFVVKELKKINEIVSCNYTTGDYGLLIKLVCKDTEHLKKTLHDKIQKIKGINSTDTMISLEESFSRVLKIEETV